MLAAFFRTNQPSALLALPVLTLLLFLPACWHAPPAAGPQMPLATLAESVMGGSLVAKGIAGMLLMILTALQLGALINDLELMERRNHLVAFLFPVAMAGIGTDGLYDPALLGMPFVLWSLRLAWRIDNTGKALQPLFDAGLLLGLATLCYLPYALVLIVLWASASVIRPFAWREYLLPLLAIGIMLYITWALLLLSGFEHWQPLHTVMNSDQHAADLFGSTPRKAFMALLVVLLLVALAAFNASYARSIVRGKNLRSAFMALALTFVVAMLFLRLLKGSFPAVLAALPAAVIACYALLQPRRAWLGEVAALSLFAIALWVRWA